ncbi:MAG: RDD family protein [Saprospiraceae bacterium]|nr:RDD family protein [Saprospiraceae bacterium]
MEKFDDILDLEEQDPFNLDYADFGTRLVAHIIDNLILGAAFFGIIGVFAGFESAGATSDSFDAMLGFLIILGAPIGYLCYHGFFESSKYGGSLGKMAMKIRVTNINGYPVSFWQAVGRNAGKFISQIIVYIGFLMVLWTPKRQALHDTMANTLVINKSSSPPPMRRSIETV